MKNIPTKQQKLSSSPGFKECVLKIVSTIPRGSVLTYKEVATRAGNPNAARAVGTIMSRNYNKNIPCHRVIGSDGSLRGFNKGVEKKREMLKEEGVVL